MPEQENIKRYVFQVIRDEVVRTEIIKAASQNDAEKKLVESDPQCTYKFLWIQTRTQFEKPPRQIWLRIFLIFTVIFLLTGLLLLILHKANYHYLFFAGLAFLMMAAVCEWWKNTRE